MVSIFSGCGGGSGKGGNPENPGGNLISPVVYAAGDFYDNNGDPIACYWVNGKQINLGNPGQSRRTTVNAIGSVNGTIYIAGDFYDINQNQCYYIINDPEPHALNNWAQANGITCSGTDVYFVGDYSTGPCYWRMGAPNPVLLSNSNNDQAFAMCIYGNDKYVAGHIQYSDSNSRDTINKAYYWKNGQPIKLSDNYSDAYSIMVKDGKVYVAGWEEISGYSRACYWANDAGNNDEQGLISVPLGTSGDNSSADSMTVSEGNIISAGGSDSTGACYWINDSPTAVKLSLGKMVKSVFASNGKIYFGGCCTDPVSKRERACYWVNDRLDPVLLGPADTRSRVSSIYVK